jgi:site-specific DNA recombinase
VAGYVVGGVPVVLCYSPDQLARKFAYQALLIEEFTRAGTRVEFIKGPRGESAEDQLLVQFQGMFTEYEKAQILERYRRGKAHRAKAGSVNVLGGAPFGYRYVRKANTPAPPTRSSSTKPPWSPSCFAATPTTAPPLRTWPGGSPRRTCPSRTGKHRWDRSVLWECCATRPMPVALCSARPWSHRPPIPTPASGPDLEPVPDQHRLLQPAPPVVDPGA